MGKHPREEWLFRDIHTTARLLQSEAFSRISIQLCQLECRASGAITGKSQAGPCVLVPAGATLDSESLEGRPSVLFLSQLSKWSLGEI